MVTSDSRTRGALDAGTRRLAATVATVAGQVASMLGTLASSSVRVAERDLLNLTQFELRRHAPRIHDAFADALREDMTSALAPRDDRDSRRRATGDWQTLSLVGDAEIEERMHADRIGQSISHACDAELRELAGYMASLLPGGRGDADRHPLRAEALGTLVYRSIEAVSPDAAARKLLAREFGRALAKAMPACYAEILLEFQALGIRPATLTARGSDAGSGGGTSGHEPLAGRSSRHGDVEPTSSRPSLDAPTSAGSGGAWTSGASTLGGVGAPAGAQADAALMALLRRLTAVGGPVDPQAPGASRPGPLDASDSRRARFDPAAAADRASTSPGDSAPDAGPISGLMAVNLIRAHREELLKASTGQLDHMVIDVVGSLFDQILSDTRVPPQMARQIARLQLPVLRVALNDSSFFSSRRHPVRRFVNRIASLACAFDDFGAGPGRQLLARVGELVQEIVDGDFDQVELYAAKLGELERFIDEQTGRLAAQSGAPATLDRKENELRLQQRCRQHLQTALAPLAMPPWLRDFVQQVWSQALVMASAPAANDPERLQRFRRAGRELVLSVQPKGSPAMRKRFLMQLPPLMKDLNEGMALVGWPASAQQQFFAVLLPSHAESMKLAPLSELDHNLLAKRLDAIFALPPGDGPAPVTLDDAGAAGEPRFSAEEAKAVGLVAETAVDWSGPVDIDLGAGPAGSADDPTTGAPAIDIALDFEPGARAGEAPEPTTGPELMDHVKLGFAYQMHLKDAWQKVRLTHVSAGRGFFVFSAGKSHQETISLTSRMLARMCRTGRFRAVESDYLFERATQRARRQLAALRPAAVAERV